MPMDNLVIWWNRSSEMDREYGRAAYQSYRSDIARYIRLGSKESFHQICAAFALLSPNSDYAGNLRSLRAVLDGFYTRPHRIPVDRLVGMATYKHCAKRAYRVLIGYPDPLTAIEEAFGKNARKTWNFYNNILNPNNDRFVTIDGHMWNLWRGKRSTLDAARIPGGGKYEEVAEDFKQVAKAVGVLPCQLQTTLWWCWKRVNGIRFDYQIDIPEMKDDGHKGLTI